MVPGTLGLSAPMAAPKGPGGAERLAWGGMQAGKMLRLQAGLGPGGPAVGLGGTGKARPRSPVEKEALRQNGPEGREVHTELICSTGLWLWPHSFPGALTVCKAGKTHTGTGGNCGGPGRRMGQGPVNQ